MIGVLANPSQNSAVQEFFELFKTPWEFYRDRDYEVLVCANGTAVRAGQAKLIVIYGSSELPSDGAQNIRVNSSPDAPRMLLGDAMRIPIYGNSVTFACEGDAILLDEESRQVGAFVVGVVSGSTVIRVGYDLFDEVAVLLTDGQPCENANLPSLDLHISLLRRIIVESGLPLVEIPPVPKGYRFIACLTHDVDHPLIRCHKFDHTFFGFLYRATVSSLLAVLSGRARVQVLWTNWLAVLKLPLVYLHFARDFWNQLDTYTRLEGGARSSFFVIPFKERPGILAGNLASKRRASGYGAGDIAVELWELMSEGHEIGLHGIDAWHDHQTGRQELEEIRRITGVEEIGVRMHWLYFDKQSPSVLEAVGVDYDSTIGYNEAVGYRAGTSQVYKPLEAIRLLELPLHVMDTSLFFADRQNLSPASAHKLVTAIIDNAVQSGGVVTVNWHDRSIAPERLWTDFYIELIEELKRKGAWLAGAGQTVQWFRKRRSTSFDEAALSDSQPSQPTDNTGEDLPGVSLRYYNSGTLSLHPPKAGRGGGGGLGESEALG